VPLIFGAYAEDLARRVATRPVRRVLEIAAGTGVVTRALAAALPAGVEIVATDLNPAMIDHAQTIGTSRPVTWRQADAMQLPFEDVEFDAIVCQFGVMFFPDKPKAFAEARRVLGPRGVFLFNVWDRIEENDFADTVTDAVATMFPADPPRFLARTPHGYHDRGAIARDLMQGGFALPRRSRRVPRPAGRSRRISRRSPTAKVPRCATRSKPEAARSSSRQPTLPLKPSRGASAAAQSKVKSRLTSSASSRTTDDHNISFRAARGIRF